MLRGPRILTMLAMAVFAGYGSDLPFQPDRFDAALGVTVHDVAAPR